MGSFICGEEIIKNTVVRVFYTRKIGNTVLVNRRYSAPNTADFHVGAVLRCTIVFDKIISYSPNTTFEHECVVRRIWEEAGERYIEVAPPVRNDGGICDVIAHGDIRLGRATLTLDFDSENQVRVVKNTAARPKTA